MPSPEATPATAADRDDAAVLLRSRSCSSVHVRCWQTVRRSRCCRRRRLPVETQVRVARRLADFGLIDVGAVVGVVVAGRAGLWS